MDIRLARARYDRFTALVLILYAAIFTALFWLVIAVLDLPGGVLAAVLGALTVLWLMWSGLYVLTWVRQRRIDVPLSLGATGILAHSQFGQLEVAWTAVQSAVIERTWSGRRLRIRLVPPGAPERAGVIDHLNPQMMKTVDKRGMRYSLRVFDITVEDLRQAFTVQSGGRVHVG